jgi:hypothetical protein
MDSREATHQAALDRWKRLRGSKDDAEEVADAATDAMNSVFGKMIKNRDIRTQLAKDLIARLRSGEKSQFKGNERGHRLDGFDDPGVNAFGIPTGYKGPSWFEREPIEEEEEY